MSKNGYEGFFSQVEKMFEDVLEVLPQKIEKFPFQSVGDLQTHVQELLTKMEPRINHWYDGNKCVLTLDVPGIKKKDLEISVEGKKLIVTGSRKAATDKEMVTEQAGAKEFKKVISIPEKYLEQPIEARHDLGVLTITLTETEDKKQKVEIN